MPLPSVLPDRLQPPPLHSAIDIGYLLDLFFDPEDGGTVILRDIGKICWTTQSHGTRGNVVD
jgi:hypothetical protein